MTAPFDRRGALFSRQYLPFKSAAMAYVPALIACHLLWPEHPFVVAAAFSVLMNLPYPAAARCAHHHTHSKIETGIAIALSAASVLGALVAPPLLIAAIFAHGLWDIAKLRGAGTPFFNWYTLSCAGVDFTYATFLTTYLWAIS